MNSKIFYPNFYNSLHSEWTILGAKFYIDHCIYALTVFKIQIYTKCTPFNNPLNRKIQGTKGINKKRGQRASLKRFGFKLYTFMFLIIANEIFDLDLIQMQSECTPIFSLLNCVAQSKRNIIVLSAEIFKRLSRDSIS